MRLEITRPDRWTLVCFVDYLYCREIVNRFLESSDVSLPSEEETVETLKPLERKCPICKAEPGRLCVLPNGRPRKVFHTKRKR